MIVDHINDSNDRRVLSAAVSEMVQSDWWRTVPVRDEPAPVSRHTFRPCKCCSGAK